MWRYTSSESWFKSYELINSELKLYYKKVPQWCCSQDGPWINEERSKLASEDDIKFVCWLLNNNIMTYETMATPPENLEAHYNSYKIEDLCNEIEQLHAERVELEAKLEKHNETIKAKAEEMLKLSGWTIT